MAAGYQELFLEQGTSYATTLTLADVNGDPYNLTNYTAKSQMKKSYYSSNTTAEFSISIISPTSGVINMSLGSPSTSNVAAGRYVYDVVIKDSANNVSRVLEGIVNVLPRVTVF
jgi:hypothetical protein